MGSEMGLAKDAWMEAQERGWHAPEKHVCADCVSDEYLKSVIDEAADSHECDYCGKRSKTAIAAPLEELMPCIMGALTHYYAEPANAGVPYESAEGGYQLPCTDTEDALLSLPFECHDQLLQDVTEAIENAFWVEAAGGSWLGVHKSTQLGYGWERFAHHVKHRQRYFFSMSQMDDNDRDLDVEPSRLLPEVADIIKDLDLIREIPAVTPLFRARVRSADDAWPLDPENLGAPPNRKAAAGRMNAAGIPYLYLALERETAVAEVIQTPPSMVAVGQFHATKPLRILDLMDLSPIPSLFDCERLRERELHIFLQRFVDSISRPVAKDGTEHIEYVPSQVVCEYFSSVFEHQVSSGESLDGILYPSTVREGGRNLVLFPKYQSIDDQFAHVKLTRAKTLSANTWAHLALLVKAKRD